MDSRTRRQIAGFWPDLIDLLLDVVPDGSLPVRLVDDWRETKDYYDIRRRTVDFLPTETDSAELLVEDAFVAAQGDGWRPADDDDEPTVEVLEQGEMTMRVGVVATEVAGASTPCCRLSVEQPWASDVAPPVDSSDLFKDVVSKVLRLDQFPVALYKEVFLDVGDLARSAKMVERVRFLTEIDLVPRLRKNGYEAADDSWSLWTARDQLSQAELTAEVRLEFGAVRLELTKVRTKSGSLPIL